MTVDEADLERLSDWAAGFRLPDLPAPLVPTAKACALYGLAVGIATIRVPSVHLISRAIDSDGGGSGPATRLLDGATSSVGNAALANSVLLSGRAQGDSHNAGHIGGVAIPSALAIAQSRRLSGASFLESMIVGYETGLRIGRDHASALSRRGFRTTPTYGAFAAAAAGAHGMGLDGEGTANALAVAANLTSGLREYVNAGTEESPLQAGFAARNGLYAALVAEAGMVAAHSAIHGPAGFYSAYGGADSDHGDRLLDGLGTDFEFAAVTYKPYPACQFLRGSISGLIALRERARGRLPASIRITLNPYEADFIGVRYYGPFTSPAQTVMSAPFCAALAWTTGGISYTGMRTYDDASVSELVPRVTIVGDPAVRRYQCVLEVVLDDGETLSLRDDGAEAEYEMHWDAAVRSAYSLCAEVGASGDAVERLVDAAHRLDGADDTSELVAATRQIIADARGSGDAAPIAAPASPSFSSHAP